MQLLHLFLRKAANTGDPSNCRPISLACLSCKHIIASSITQHANVHNILYHLQHGFRYRRSCETQLVGFIQDAVNSMRDGFQTDVLIMDFARRVTKLVTFALSQNWDLKKQLKWIHFFLSGRKQNVVLEGLSSDDAHVLSGVPQGSVLGSSLFLFYINDSPKSLASNVRMFADDTVVHLDIHSDSDTRVLQNDLDNLLIGKSFGKWNSTWEKCKVLRVGRKCDLVENDCVLRGETLASVTVHLWLDSLTGTILVLLQPMIYAGTVISTTSPVKQIKPSLF